MFQGADTSAACRPTEQSTVRVLAGAFMQMPTLEPELESGDESSFPGQFGVKVERVELIIFISQIEQAYQEFCPAAG